MGKNLKNADLVLRTGKMAFYLVPGNSAYTRMEGFTSLSSSKGATEYERQYVDEDFKRTDITGYNTSIAYALDRYKQHPVTDDIILIHENELLGQDAVRSIIQVDMTTAEAISGGGYKAQAKRRDYAVIPDTDGDTTDCLTYSGTFKTRGEMEDVEVHTTDNWQTIFVPGEQTAPVLTSISLLSGTLSPAFNRTTTSYTTAQTGTLTVTAVAESSTYTITGMHDGTSHNMQGSSATFNNLEVGDFIYITVHNGGTGVYSTRTYSIGIVASSGMSTMSDDIGGESV